MLSLVTARLGLAVLLTGHSENAGWPNSCKLRIVTLAEMATEYIHEQMSPSFHEDDSDDENGGDESLNDDKDRDEDSDGSDAHAATDARGEPFPDPPAGRLHRPQAQPIHRGRRSGVPMHQLWEGD